jgi:hypothetical protein
LAVCVAFINLKVIFGGLAAFDILVGVTPGDCLVIFCCLPTSPPSLTPGTVLFAGLDLPAGFANPAICVAIWATHLLPFTLLDVVAFSLVEVRVDDMGPPRYLQTLSSSAHKKDLGGIHWHDHRVLDVWRQRLCLWPTRRCV